MSLGYDSVYVVRLWLDICHVSQILAAGPVGLMQASMDLVLPYIHSRSQFCQPIANFQVGIQVVLSNYGCLLVLLLFMLLI